MRRRVLNFVIGTFGFTVFIIALAWIFLSMPYFAQMRTQITSRLLSNAAGYPLSVKEDARLRFGWNTEVVIQGVELSGSENPDDALATLGHLKFELNLLNLLSGQLQPDQMVLDGLQVNLLTHADGSNNWSIGIDNQDLTKTVPSANKGTNDQTYVTNVGIHILAYFLKKNATFGSVGLNIDNQVTGFSFVFDLGHLNFVQKENRRLEISGAGMVNEQPFNISADIPEYGFFGAHLEFGGVTVAVEGETASDAIEDSFTGTFTLRTGEIEDLLEVMRLKPVIAGNAELTADIAFESDVLHVEKLDATVELSDGKQARVEGSIVNFFAAEGLNLNVVSRFHPSTAQPKTANKLKDMVLTGLSATIVGDLSNLEFEDVRLRTNAFDADLNELGPVSIRGIQRTQDGYLAFQDISVQAGKTSSAHLGALGHIENVLQLRDYGFKGQIGVPASFVLTSLRKEEAKPFGRLEAEFTVDDSGGLVTLRQLKARSVDTELWELNANARIGNLIDLQDTALDFALDIADSARFLRTLDLREVDIGAFSFSGSAKHASAGLQVTVGLGAGGSRIDANLDTTDKDGARHVRGRVFSEKLELADLSKAVRATVEIQKLIKSQQTQESAELNPHQDLEGYQPLVLEKIYAPLVLPPEKPNLGDLLSFEQILRETDLIVDIDIKKLTGQQGVSSIASKLVVDQGKARLGPLEVKYGGGFLKLDTRMDLIRTPDLLSVSGVTSGWDFGKILESIGVDIQASGKLNAEFNLTGNSHSSKAFINSMYGVASVKVSEGTIATSLLELAGLGIFPWLFSKALANGYTDIVCISAPLRIEAGKVNINPLVAETRKVQVVAAGNLDWRKGTIALIAEPRPVSRPWARTAWPFGISGSLSKPEFKIHPNVKLRQTAKMTGRMPVNRRPCIPDARQLE
jgi:AsmA family protein